MKRIRRRQILEHLYLKAFWKIVAQPQELEIALDAYKESLVSAWIQRTFLDIWE